MKKIIFRISCGEKSGVGHLMRSIWLSKSLKKLKNFKIIFFINNDSFSKKILKKHKIKYQLSNSEFPLTFSEAKSISKLKPNLVICDSPKISNRWFKFFVRKNFKTLEICSEKNFSNLSDYKLWPETYPKGLRKKINRYGLKYSLLSPQYWTKFPQKKNIKIKNILITFGGCDHLNLTEIFIRSLNFFSRKLNIKIVIGKFYKNINNIKVESRRSKHKVSILNQPQGLYNYLKKSDLVINGGGTTALEANNLRIKSMTIAIWKTQEKLTRKISKNNNFIMCNNKSKFEIKRQIEKLLKKNLYQEGINKKVKREVDGKGCIRAAKWIKTLLT